jgi:hypothetical protein
MELRIVIEEGLLSPATHRIMKSLASYVSATYNLTPGLMDLEGAIFDDVDEGLCYKIVDDIKKKFRRQLRYIEVACL